MTAYRDPRFFLRVAALALLGAALVPWSITVARPVFDVVAILDITGSMNTTDQTLDGRPVSRLEMERRAVHRLLAALPCGSRLGLGIFVEKQPFLLFQPVETCANFPALDMEISELDWRMGWDSESQIAQTLARAMPMAAKLGADLIFMTDGQEEPPLWWSGMPNFAPLRGSIAGVIEGVGGSVLAPIPKYDTNGHPIGFFKPGDVPTDKEGIFVGHEYLSAVDTPHLRQLAGLSGLAYRHLDGEDDLYPALTQVAQPRLHPTRLDLRWLFASAALAVLVVCGII